MTERAYDEVPYEGSIAAHSAPEHLVLCARAFGVAAPALDGARVLELGCGKGRNLLALAYHRPNMRFLGVDRSSRYIEEARAAAASLGLTNITFLAEDIDGLSLAETPFAVIIAHGVLSWVPDATKRGLMRAMAEHLADDGLAYVSFNAMPGWGIRGAMREYLRRRGPFESLAGSAEVAQQRARRLLGLLGEPESHLQGAVHRELTVVDEAAPWYLVHDHLAEHNDPLWFGQLLELASPAGLKYVGDAMLGFPEGAQQAALRADLAADGVGLVEVEETVDLLGGRFMRAALLGKQAPQASGLASLLDEVHIAAALAATSDPFQLADGVEEDFADTNDRVVGVSDALTKAALLNLAAQWPAGAPLAEVIASARTLLADHDCPAPPTEDALRAALGELFGAGLIDWRLVEPPRPPGAPMLPTLAPLARWELARGAQALTSPHHVPIAFDAEERALLRGLDGETHPREIAEPELADRTVTHAARWGLLA